MAFGRAFLIVLGTLLLLSAIGMPVHAQAPAPTDATTTAAETPNDIDVSSLPATGRAHQSGDGGSVAAEQMLLTALVLVAAGALALAVLALAWRHERQ